MGCVSMWMLIVFFMKCCSSCGVCKSIVGFAWLCMHIIDVNDGFVC